MAEFPPFEISRRFEGALAAVPVIVVAGELDVVTVPEVVGVIRAAAAAQPARVVVDLGAVRFIDAAGIGALLAAAETARGAGCTVVLRHPSPTVRRVLDMFELNGALPVEGEDGESA